MSRRWICASLVTLGVAACQPFLGPEDMLFTGTWVAVVDGVVRAAPPAEVEFTVQPDGRLAGRAVVRIPTMDPPVRELQFTGTQEEERVSFAGYDDALSPVRGDGRALAHDVIAVRFVFEGIGVLAFNLVRA